MLTAEVRQEIAEHVRMGFYDKDRLLSIFCEEMYEPGKLDAGEVSDVIDQETVSWNAEKQSWPAVTDCDRLNLRPPDPRPGIVSPGVARVAV